MIYSVHVVVTVFMYFEVTVLVTVHVVVVSMYLVSFLHVVSPYPPPPFLSADSIAADEVGDGVGFRR